MSSINNGDDLTKMKITCGVCKQQFSVPKPRLEISNNTFCSVVTGPHQDIIRCIMPKCRTPYVLMLGINEHSQLIWGVQPVDEKFVAEATGSAVIKPNLTLAN